jgi:hypothetical protein
VPCSVCTRLSDAPVDRKLLLSVQRLEMRLGPINRLPLTIRLSPPSHVRVIVSPLSYLSDLHAARPYPPPPRDVPRPCRRSVSSTPALAQMMPTPYPSFSDVIHCGLHRHAEGGVCPYCQGNIPFLSTFILHHVPSSGSSLPPVCGPSPSDLTSLLRTPEKRRRLLHRLRTTPARSPLHRSVQPPPSI